MSLTVHICLLVASTSLLLLLCSSTPCLSNQYEICFSGTFTCDNIEFSYPFGKNGSGCGDPEFQIHSCDYHPQINIGGNIYQILASSFMANSSIHKMLRIVNDNLLGSKCNPSGNYSEFWWSASQFHILDTYTNLTLWKQCGDQIPDDFHGSHLNNLIRFCGEDWHYSLSQHFDLEQRHFCNTFQLPVKKYLQSPHFINYLQGFEVTWQLDPNRYQSCEQCLNSNGRCGYNISKPTTFLCYCPDGSSSPDKCPDNGTEETGDQNMSAISIGCFTVGVAATAIGLAIAVFLKYDLCKRRNPPPPQLLQGNESVVVGPLWFVNEQRVFVLP